MTIKLTSARIARTGFAALLLAGVSSVAMAQTPDAAPAASASDARIAQLEAEVQQLADEVQDLKRGQAEQIMREDRDILRTLAK